jgi:hypothetical protein
MREENLSINNNYHERGEPNSEMIWKIWKISVLVIITLIINTKVLLSHDNYY